MDVLGRGVLVEPVCIIMCDYVLHCAGLHIVMLGVTGIYLALATNRSLASSMHCPLKSSAGLTAGSEGMAGLSEATT